MECNSSRVYCDKQQINDINKVLAEKLAESEQELAKYKKKEKEKYILVYRLQNQYKTSLKSLFDT